jgi:hypothetical protein
MCEKCKQIDARILQHRQILADVNDQIVVALVTAFVADLEDEKTALHPEPPN